MAVTDYDDGTRLIQNVPVFNQGNTNTCSQACVTSILNYWGYNTRYEDVIAETSNPTMTMGMTPEQIVWYFRKFNLTAKCFKGNLQALKTQINKGLPCIVGFDELQIQHVVVVVGYNDEKELIFYNDSMYGEMIEEPYSDFITAWNRRRLNSTGFNDISASNLLIQVSR